MEILKFLKSRETKKEFRKINQNLQTFVPKNSKSKMWLIVINILKYFDSGLLPDVHKTSQSKNLIIIAKMKVALLSIAMFANVAG